jgi:RHS repeat-associated protein
MRQTTAWTRAKACGLDGLSRLNALSRAAGASSSTVGYDNADRMNALAHVFTPTTGNQTWGFGFTPASQLATTSSSNAAWNWTAATAAAVNTVADGLNRNATVAGVTQTYDRFGNLTSDGTRTFTYDSENRPLTESGPVTLALSYDPMGRLQQSVINGTTIQFLYDDDALVGEYPATGNTPLRRYVQGVGTDNPLMWYEGVTMTAAYANYLLTDRQGSIVGTGNSSGALTVNYTYDAHGAPNTWGTVGTVPRFRYTGQAAIPEAKLYHYKARVYDPVSGRFLQTDPVGYGPDVNWYAYARNDPVDKTDPSGETPAAAAAVLGETFELDLVEEA